VAHHGLRAAAGPEITAHQAVAASIFLETIAASIGIYQYYSRRLIDFPLVKTLGVIVLPAAIVGVLVSHWVPEPVIQVVYAVLMLSAARLLIKRVRAGKACSK
jgi:uncharacterized membrane protein YfcA